MKRIFILSLAAFFLTQVNAASAMVSHPQTLGAGDVAASQPADDDPGVTVELDSLYHQLFSAQPVAPETDRWVVDSISTVCWKNALQQISGKYGSKSEELADCYLYVGERLIDVDYPFSDSHIFSDECLNKALEIYKLIFGESSNEVGITYNMLVYAAGRDVETAKKHAVSALAIFTPKYGNQSPIVAYTYWYLGNSYRLSNHDVYRVGAQTMMVSGSEYFAPQDYEEIIATLKTALSYYEKARDIFAQYDNYAEKLEDVKADIESTELELEANQADLKEAKKMK